MPTLNPAFALVEYVFTEEEMKLAKILTPLQQQYYQTLRAHLFLQRNTVPVPEDKNLDRSYIAQIAELDGRIGFIQQMFDDHIEAVKGIAENQVNPVDLTTAVGQTLAARASNSVDNPRQE